MMCRECGAAWVDGATCTDHFYQMLYWEWEDMPRLGAAHHLMVLCYHLQHPHLYSPEMLAGGMTMLVDFLENGVTPAAMRHKLRAEVASDRRKYRIAGTPEAHGRYEQPVAWTMTAADVVAGGMDRYVAQVERWAWSILAALRATGDIPARA